jgi:hypothetical protein
MLRISPTTYREQAIGAQLGIAIDLNSETNQQGTKGSMDANLVAVFQSAGFSWGGAWEGKTKDPMHFQFCTGY